MVGFTATPVVKQSSDADTLLSIIKGPYGSAPTRAAEATIGPDCSPPKSHNECNNEGFVSFYNSLPPANFPRVLPAGVPTRAMPLIRPVQVPLNP